MRNNRKLNLPRFILSEAGNNECEENVQNEKHEIDLKQEVENLKAELILINYKLYNQPMFDIDDFKNNDKDISFYTGFPNYETVLLCYRVLEHKLHNISYGYHSRSQFDLLEFKQPGLR